MVILLFVIGLFMFGWGALLMFHPAALRVNVYSYKVLWAAGFFFGAGFVLLVTLTIVYIK